MSLVIQVLSKSGGTWSEQRRQHPCERSEGGSKLSDVMQECRSARREWSCRLQNIKTSKHFQGVALIGWPEFKEQCRLGRKQNLTDGFHLMGREPHRRE
jgi:hypothetical protein